MDFGEKLNGEVLELLERLGNEASLALTGEVFFKFSIFPNEVAPIDQTTAQQARTIADERRKILRKLADLGAIEYKSDEDEIDGFGASFLVKVNQKRFEGLLNDLKDKRTSTFKGSSARNHLFIDADGNFWLEPKDKLCYAMEVRSDRFKILSFLVENEGYRGTDEIAEHLGGKNKQRVRTEITKIRNNIKKFLKIDGDEVIEAKKDSGYRINPTYKVIRV